MAKIFSKIHHLMDVINAESGHVISIRYFEQARRQINLPNPPQIIQFHLQRWRGRWEEPEILHPEKERWDRYGGWCKRDENFEHHQTEMKLRWLAVRERTLNNSNGGVVFKGWRWLLEVGRDISLLRRESNPHHQLVYLLNRLPCLWTNIRI